MRVASPPDGADTSSDSFIASDFMRQYAIRILRPNQTPTHGSIVIRLHPARLRVVGSIPNGRIFARRMVAGDTRNFPPIITDSE
eukprot:5142777-Prymnesium_polylepis.1